MQHFQISEFASPDIEGSGIEMDLDFLNMIDEAREEAGIPFIINSGYRSAQHNRLTNGSETSSHLKGLAVDIRCLTGSERIKIIHALIMIGFTRIGIAETFIHVDADLGKEDSIWIY